MSGAQALRGLVAVVAVGACAWWLWGRDLPPPPAPRGGGDDSSAPVAARATNGEVAGGLARAGQHTFVDARCVAHRPASGARTVDGQHHVGAPGELQAGGANTVLLPVGRYTLTVEVPGFAPVTRAVAVAAAETIAVEVALR